MKRTGLLLTLLLVAAVGLASRVAVIAGEDMAPSLMPGDLVFILPSQAMVPGDVVVLSDPLDPSRKIVRRVLAVAGQTITTAETHIKVDKRRLRAAAMGDMGPHMVTKETLWAKRPAVGASWLTRIQADPPSQWSAGPIEIPDRHVFLMADDRDHTLDSRWWGPLPVERIEGIVRARWGDAHTWRPRWEILAGTAPLGA